MLANKNIQHLTLNKKPWNNQNDLIKQFVLNIEGSHEVSLFTKIK